MTQIIDATPWRTDRTRIVKVEYLYQGVSYTSKEKEVLIGTTVKRICPACGNAVMPAEIKPSARGRRCAECRGRS